VARVKFLSKCKVCETSIATGSGDVRKVDGQWYTTCDSHTPKIIANLDGYRRRQDQSRYDYNQQQNGHKNGCECKSCMWDEC